MKPTQEQLISPRTYLSVPSGFVSSIKSKEEKMGENSIEIENEVFSYKQTDEVIYLHGLNYPPLVDETPRCKEMAAHLIETNRFRKRYFRASQ